MEASLAVMRGLRSAGNEPQLTRVLASVFQADPSAAAGFVRVLLDVLERDAAPADATLASPPPCDDVPFAMECVAEEAVEGGRVDLRFRAEGWDVIVELKIHAGYRPGQLEDYCKALDPVDHAGVIAITRDVPTYGEPPRGSLKGWLGALRWRKIADGLQGVTFVDEVLGAHWIALLEVLKEEGSMGFLGAKPELFEMFAGARLARQHVEELLRCLEHPLRDALRGTRGEDESSADFFWQGGGKLSTSADGRIDIPFRVPADGEWRVRAGFQGWEPPTALFHVRLAPLQRWRPKLGRMSPEARASVEHLVAHGFDPDWMAKSRPLTKEVLLRPDLEEQLLRFAREQFDTICASGIFEVGILDLAGGVPPVADTETAA